MSSYTLKCPTPASVLYVALHLRVEDKQELETASGGLSAVEAVFRSWAYSAEAYVFEVEEVPVLIFGVLKDGTIWLVGTPGIEKNAKRVFRLSKEVLPQLQSRYPVLHNKADCRNKLHLKWLIRMGFTMGNYVYVGEHRFRTFARREEPETCVQES
jgi:hypothetical protein